MKAAAERECNATSAERHLSQEVGGAPFDGEGIPFYHFIAEARYNGAAVINISTGVSPRTSMATSRCTQEPINGGTGPGQWGWPWSR